MAVIVRVKCTCCGSIVEYTEYTEYDYTVICLDCGFKIR